jgi:ethanolamine utilization protein EutA
VKDVRLVALDFGTTTSRCVAATARLARNVVTGRNELSDVCEVFRSPVEFTPFCDAGLDERRLADYLDAWLAAAAAEHEAIFGGGALVTGLAAQQPNSPALIELIRSRVRDVLVASAGDPNLEAWLAFQANAGAISRARANRWVINLDIGGGTTNLALGQAGEVLRTGSLFVGARHIQVDPGTYRIVKLSHYARAILNELGIPADTGDCFTPSALGAVLDWQLELIENALAPNRIAFQSQAARLHEQVSFNPPAEVTDPIVCLSGGMGELVYQMLRGEEQPPTTCFGDLGIDLARRIADSPRWRGRLAEAMPPDAGRATVYGLLLYATRISGSTTYLSDATLLPLRDVPIFGRITSDSTDEQIRDIFQLLGRSSVGGCVAVLLSRQDALAVRSVGERVGSALWTVGGVGDRPVVILARQNIGKALGGYVSQWGTIPLKLIVLDEIEPLDARFVQIGSPRDQVVPVSFYGMR